MFCADNRFKIRSSRRSRSRRLVGTGPASQGFVTGIGDLRPSPVPEPRPRRIEQRRPPQSHAHRALAFTALQRPARPTIPPRSWPASRRARTSTLRPRRGEAPSPAVPASVTSAVPGTFLATDSLPAGRSPASPAASTNPQVSALNPPRAPDREPSPALADSLRSAQNRSCRPGRVATSCRPAEDTQIARHR